MQLNGVGISTASDSVLSWVRPFELSAPQFCERKSQFVTSSVEARVLWWQSPLMVCWCACPAQMPAVPPGQQPWTPMAAPDTLEALVEGQMTITGPEILPFTPAKQHMVLVVRLCLGQRC